MQEDLQIQAVDEKKQVRQRRLRQVGVVAGAALVLGLGAALVWYVTPPALPQTLQEAKGVVASVRYQRLSKQDKQPYLDVIREQFGSLDRDERRKLMEDEELRAQMRDARMQMVRSMLLQQAQGDGAELVMPFGRPGAERPDRGERPERTEEEKAERAERMRDRISDRFTNGDSQMNQLMREMFSQRRKQRK